ncbi:flagellar basal body rod protein FlgC [Pseudotabrizicola algicola]|uniref:Flagellar basal-body rod protein FlgC n=1 Tax=Pseudotabrizicola algicola TaxID=2709381 RepID=A0A6B3RJ85_9RHOB|nr:flagellar basal body rod protein FlgC [Pseudotabrizicola algicola]NEX45246.1 flagellar basal body rod protein FlgC [Pseudotabrizicola algicola]
MAEIRNVFDIGTRALSAQMQRLNTTASNLANAGTVAGSAEGAFRALRPVFVVDEAAPGTGLTAPRAAQIVALDREPVRMFRPDHPQADAEGYVFEAAVQVEEEMVEMLEASRQYQNTLESLSTLRALMARTLSMGE